MSTDRSSKPNTQRERSLLALMAICRPSRRCVSSAGCGASSTLPAAVTKKSAARLLRGQNRAMKEEVAHREKMHRTVSKAASLGRVQRRVRT
jgi:hypothetical protein